MTTHTMTRDTNSTRIQLRECLEDGLGQFLRHIGIHVIPIVIGGFGSVDVEAGSSTKVICIIFTLDVQSAWPALED